MQACKAWRAWVGNSEEHPLVATLVSGLIVSQGSLPHHVHVYIHMRARTYTRKGLLLSPRNLLLILAACSARAVFCAFTIRSSSYRGVLTLSLTSLARRRRTTLSGHVVGTVGPVFASCEPEEGRVETETRRGLSCLSLSRLVSPLTLWLLDAYGRICASGKSYRRMYAPISIRLPIVSIKTHKSCSVLKMDTCTYLLTTAINKILLMSTTSILCFTETYFFQG